MKTVTGQTPQSNPPGTKPPVKSPLGNKPVLNLSRLTGMCNLGLGFALILVYFRFRLDNILLHLDQDLELGGFDRGFCSVL